MTTRTPSQQVKAGRVYGPAVKLQHLDARGFDRLTTLDTSNGIELQLGSMCTLDKGTHGPGYAFGLHLARVNARHTRADTTVTVLGMIDTNEVNWDQAAKALNARLATAPAWISDPLVTIIVRTGNTTTWQTLAYTQPQTADTLAEHAHRGTTPDNRQLHTTITEALSAELSDGWYARQLHMAPTVRHQLAWEFGLEEHLDKMHTSAIQHGQQRIATIGPWPVHIGVHSDTQPGNETDQATIHLERGNWLNPTNTLRTIHTIAANPDLAGRWDLQDDYHQLRTNGTPMRIAANVLTRA